MMQRQAKHTVEWLQWLIALLLLLLSGAESVLAQEEPPTRLTHETPPAWSSPLLFFQKVISRADGDRCTMHPSCSRYAAEAFEKHHILTAWVLTCDRLLRCGHDEIAISPTVYAQGKPRVYDPLEANTFWWRKPCAPSTSRPLKP